MPFVINGIKGEYMIVNKIIEYVCMMLDKNDLLLSPLLSGQEDTDEDRREDVELILKCINFSNVKLATLYQPLTKSVTVDSSNPVVLTTYETKQVLNILSVKDQFGESVAYRLEGKKIILPYIGLVTIKYSYYPDDVTYGDQCIDMVEGIHDQIFALSVASDYCFFKGLNDEMSKFEEEFQNQIKNIVRKKSDIYIKPRRWI